MTKWYRFGEMMETDGLTPEHVREVLAQGRELRDACRAVPILSVIETLDEVGKRLADPVHPIRRQALDELPGIVGFSRPMIEAGIDALVGMLKRENLLTRLRTDIGDVQYLDDFVYHPGFDGFIKAEPRGIMAHVAAGNVFVGAVDSLVQGIVTKNVNLLKMAGADPLFPLLFARAVLEVDHAGIISRTFALLPFRGGDAEVESLLKQHCDTIIVYGGEDTVRAYRDGLALHNRLVEYGPKYSCVMIDESELERRGETEIAQLVARDFTMWDQSACSSPHTVFVAGKTPESSAAAARRFSDALAEGLAYWDTVFPAGAIPFQEKVEITRVRELARVGQAQGKAALLVPDRKVQDWTVVYEDDPTFRVSCHHRAAYVKPVATLEQALDIVGPYGQFIQTVAVVADAGSTFHLSDRLVKIGADRIVEAGNMARRRHGTPHDGTRGTDEMVRWVSLAAKTPFSLTSAVDATRFTDAFSYQPDVLRDQITLARLNAVLDVCREKSPFYKDRLPNKPLRSLDEVRDIPVLSQADFRNALPPDGSGLLTGPLEGCYAFASGGTTGKPKYVYRTVEEQHRNARALAKGLYLSAFRPGDVVANLLYAGNLWASFLSFTQALEMTGCMILPIAGSIDIEFIARYMTTFRPNGAISIPSVFLSLAQYVEQHNLDLKIEKIATGGEHLFPDAKAYLTEVFGTKRFTSPAYATNDNGAIAFQCEVNEGAVHHVHEDIHVVEIVDPHTGDPVPEGEVGKMIVTNIDRTLMPTIRYDVGDLGRFIPGVCGCGRGTRRIELLGRTDEVLVIGGLKVPLDVVATVVGKISGLSHAFRMIARRVDQLDQLVIEVEAGGDVDDARREALEREVVEGVRNFKAEYARFGKSGVAPIVAHVPPPGTLPRNPRTGKIAQVVDERIGH